jgi:hypothetical protein
MRKFMNLRSVLSRKTALVAAGGAAMVALSATAAFAYWTTSGSGTGSATTGASQAVHITQVGSVAGLVPGGVAKAVDFKITNSATTPQYVKAVIVSIDSISNPGCSAADFTLVQPTAINADLAAGDTAFSPSGATIKLEDTTANQDACKGATVNLAFSAS